MFNKKKFLIGIMALVLSSFAYAEMVETEINGYSVEYYVPDTSQAKTPENMQMSLKVLIDDPTPLPDDYRPITNPVLLMDRVSKATSTTFTIDYIPHGGYDHYDQFCYTFPNEARVNFENAARIWADSIDSSVPIAIQACWGSLAGSTLGYSGGYSIPNFVNRPIANTYYKSSLANSLAGSDLLPSEYDMWITYNKNFPWYYGIDGNTPNDKHDLLTVVLHEMTHGLNFSGNMHYGSGTYACSGSNYGCYRTYPGVWDRLIVNGSGTSLLNTANDSLAMGSALTSGNLYFNGPKARAANGGNKVKIYAPSVWASGSSFTHLDYDTFNNTSNELMVFAISKGEATHIPGNIALGMLEDMGWKRSGSPSSDSSYMVPIISYLLSDSAGASPSKCVVGTWDKSYDWECNGNPGSVRDTLRADGTWSDSQGSSGTWTQTGDQYTQVFTGGTTYRGTVNSLCSYMQGTMVVPSTGRTGCWNASRTQSKAVEGAVITEYDGDGLSANGE